MEAARWRQIQQLFRDVVDQTPDVQRRLLDAAARDDEALGTTVRAMLAADRPSDSILDRDVLSVAGQLLDDSPPESAPPLQFGPFRVTGRLPAGGMGVVYRAVRDDIGQVAAIKLPGAWISRADWERSRSEQETLAQLNHPAIATLYDAGTLDDGTPWFAMEFVDGLTLIEHCRLHAPSLGSRLRLFTGVCRAVQYVHEHVIVHRDLKPSNIMVSREGAIKLLDFGIAKRLRGVDPRAAQTAPEFRPMSWAYAAPEQFTSSPVTVRADVYSLGVVLYELLADRRPLDLDGLGPTDAERTVRDQTPPAPSVAARSRAGAPRAGAAEWVDLDLICLSAMHKDPLRRYETVAELTKDVERFLTGRPIAARRDSVAYRARKFVTRNTRPIAATMAGILAIAAVVIFYTVQLASARDRAVGEAARSERILQSMVNLFDAGENEVSPSSELRVVQLLDRGEQAARALGHEPAVQAELYHTLGRLRQGLGDFEHANQLLTAALARRQQLYPADHRDNIETTMALAELRADQAKWADAERFARSALDSAQRALPESDPLLARAHATLGNVLEDNGKYDLAIHALDEAVRRYARNGALGVEYASALTELANAHFYAGRNEIAEELNLQALARNRQIRGGDHPAVADGLLNLGAIRFQRSDYPAAERYDRDALDIIQRWYGEHPETASAMTILAQALTAQGKFDEARSLLDRSVGMLRRVSPPMHPRIAFALNELGVFALERGDLGLAETSLREALAIQRTVFKDGEHMRVGAALHNIGRLELARRHYPEAESALREALGIFSRVLPAGHQRIGVSRAMLGRVLLREGRDADAEVESRAGYDILTKLPDPPPVWVRYVRDDLVEEYHALGRAEDAVQFEESR